MRVVTQRLAGIQLSIDVGVAMNDAGHQHQCALRWGQRPTQATDAGVAGLYGTARFARRYHQAHAAPHRIA